jgi:hypothetical protein
VHPSGRNGRIQGMSKLGPAMVLGLLLAATSATAGAADVASSSWHFQALLDGRPIGAHDFVLTHQDDEVVIDDVAHFKVTVALIPLYAYDHQNHEAWHNGCLASIASHTNDNGRKVFVHGAMTGDAFEIEGSRGAETLAGCVHTFAYWDRESLLAPRLLNAQNGEYQAVTLTQVGIQRVTVHGQSIAATRYALRGAHLSIDVWYSESDRWVALESKLESGRTLRYEIQ